MMSFPLNRLALAALVTGSFLTAGCAFDASHTPQPAGSLRFPGALALSSDASKLYVVGTNFDLSYDTGLLQTFDLNWLDQQIEEASSWPLEIDLQQAASAPALLGEAQIDSFGGLPALALGPEGQDRLFIPARARGVLAVVDAAADGSLSCVEDAAPNATGGGSACDQSALLLPAPSGETLDDPFATVVVGSEVWVATLSAQALDLDAPQDASDSYFARVAIDSPASASVLSADAMLARQLQVGPQGQVWAAGQVLTGSASTPELRIYDPGSFETDTVAGSAGLLNPKNISLSGLVGRGELRGFAFSGDMKQVYVSMRSPDRLLILERSSTYGLEGFVLRASVPLPSSPARMLLLPVPEESSHGDLIAMTGLNPDALMIVDADAGALVGLLDGTHCDPAGVCPSGSSISGARSPSREPGERPFDLVSRPLPAGGIRLWISSFGLSQSGAGGLLAVDIRDPRQPWQLGVSAIVFGQGETP